MFTANGKREIRVYVFLKKKEKKKPSTVNSLYCGHPRDRELVSLIARVRNSVNLFQSNVCNLFLPPGDSATARIVRVNAYGESWLYIDENSAK